MKNVLLVFVLGGIGFCAFDIVEQNYGFAALMAVCTLLNYYNYLKTI